MILFLGVTFHHAQSGMQVVLEDYVSSHGPRIFAIIAVKFVCYALAALSIISVLIVAFGV
jgi:succinate dehydrogenase / fumarate reductase membrane anchor subunit